MLKKIASLIICLPVLTLAGTLHSKPDDVEKFKTTGQCPACDLSGYWALSTSATGSVDLKGANLSKTYFSLSEKRQYSDFSGVFAVDMSLANTDLSYSNFNNAKLASASFIYDNFTGANFSGADVTSVNFSGANLYQAKISQQQLNSAGTLCNAILPDGTKGKC